MCAHGQVSDSCRGVDVHVYVDLPTGRDMSGNPLIHQVEVVRAVGPVRRGVYEHGYRHVHRCGRRHLYRCRHSHVYRHAPGPVCRHVCRHVYKLVQFVLVLQTSVYTTSMYSCHRSKSMPERNVYKHVYRHVHRHVYRHLCRHVYRYVYRLACVRIDKCPTRLEACVYTCT